MKLTIIGTGYVGLVTGTCFAEVGHEVICVDNNAEKVEVLRKGKMPIYEPGLDELVEKNVAAGRLQFTTSTPEGVEKSDVIFIAVPTPPLPDGSVDLSFIEKVAREIAQSMTSYKVVVDKSTVPVKTGDKVAETIKRYCKARVDFDVVSNPEFLREGFAVDDFMHPDRVVVGLRSPRPVQAMKSIYEQLGYDFHLLKEVQHINADQMERFIKKMTDTLWVLKDKTIGVLGLAFKQNTDDVRLSPAIDLCHRLQKEGARLRVHDPRAMDKAKAVLQNVTYV